MTTKGVYTTRTRDSLPIASEMGSYKNYQAGPPKRLQSLILKLEIASLNTSAIGIHPDCAAGTAKPAPAVLALSLKGLQTQP